jgi:competence protein ComEC
MHHWWDGGVYDWEPSKAYAGVALSSNSKNYFHQNNFIQFYDKKILVVDSLMNNASFHSASKTNFDYAVVGLNSDKALKKLLQQFKFKQIIIDSSNNYKSVKKIKWLCRENKIPFYDVNANGAFVLKM